MLVAPHISSKAELDAPGWGSVLHPGRGQEAPSGPRWRLSCSLGSTAISSPQCDVWQLLLKGDLYHNPTRDGRRPTRNTSAFSWPRDGQRYRQYLASGTLVRLMSLGAATANVYRSW